MSYTDDLMVMTYLQGTAAGRDEHREDSGYKALSDEGKKLADSFLDAFYAAKTPMEFGKMFFGSPEEEPEIITADTAQSLSFEDLVNAFDKISVPTTAIDVPLPYDPDDFTVI